MTFTPPTASALLSSPSHSGLHNAGYIDASVYGVSSSETAANNATYLQAALTAAADKPVFLPYGTISYNTTLLLKQGQRIHGWGTGDTLGNSTILSYTGADGTNGMEFFTTNSSRVWLEGFRLVNATSPATSGTGIYLSRGKNLVRLRNLLVTGFKTAQVYIGATAGQTTECVHVSDLWVGSQATYGLHLERVDNNVSIDHVMGDSTSTATMTSLIHIDNVSTGQGVFDIRSVKLESNNGCHLLGIGSGFQGSLNASALTLRGDTTNGGGDVVNIGSTLGDYTLSALGSMKYAGGAAGGANLINDTAAGVTYGAGKRSLPFQIINKNAHAGIGIGDSGAKVGFYGVAPIARATLATGGGATVDNVITALQNLGLVKQS